MSFVNWGLLAPLQWGTRCSVSMGLAHASWTLGKQHIDPHCEIQPCNSLFQQLSPHGYNLPNNELEAKFSMDLEMPFWSITLGQRVQMPFFLYISCIQCHWDTHTDLSRAFRQWLLSQGLFISFIKSRHKPQGWLLAEAVESCSSTFHTHALLTALNRFLINPSNSMNQDCTHGKNTQPWKFRHSPENGRASLNRLAERRDWAHMTGPGWVQGSILTLGGGIRRTGAAAAAAASLLYLKQRQQPTTAFLQMQSGRAASAAGGQTWHWAAQFCWGWQGSGHTQRHSFRCLGNHPGSSQQLCEHRGIEIWAQTV